MNYRAPVGSQRFDEATSPETATATRVSLLAKIGFALFTSLAFAYTTVFLVLRRLLLATVSVPAHILPQWRWLEQCGRASLGIALALVAESALLLRPSVSISLPLMPAAGMEFLFTALLFVLAILGGYAALRIPSGLGELHRSSDPRKSLLARQLRNPLDAVFVRLSLRQSALVSLPFFAVIAPQLNSPLVIVLYILIVALCSETFELLDHTTIHRSVFAPSKAANRSIRTLLKALALWHDYVATIMMARVPFRYRVQHVFVHHVENNGPDDPQTTLRYDRTSYFDFCRFALSSCASALIPWDIARYLVRKKRYRPLTLLVLGTLGWFGLIVVLAYWNAAAALILISMRLAAGVGIALLNFSEHGLVDPEAPSSIYRNALTVQVRDDDHGSLGADFHIAHHLHPGRHWSVLAEDARNNADTYRNQGVIIHREPESFLRKLLLRRFDLIAASCITKGLSLTDMTAEIQRRARPRRKEPQSALVRRADRLLANVAAQILI